MPPSTEPMTLLLIEDSYDDGRLALRALRECGESLVVRVAREGGCAKRLLGLDGDEVEAPDLVISDLKLPGLHGDELLRLARADARLARIPYVLFSSSREAADVERCLRYGASAYVQKPVGFEEDVEGLKAVVRWAVDGFPVAEAPDCVVGTPTTCPCVRRGV
jgi:CheY-like chemotaxis protein